MVEVSIRISIYLNTMIWVDPRVGSKELFHPLQFAGLQRIPKVEVQQSTTILDFGDFIMDGVLNQDVVMVGVERKTIGDFIQSMRTGRLSGHQIPGLSESFDYAYILLEGLLRPNNEGFVETFRYGHWQTYLLGRQPILYREVLDFTLHHAHSSGIVFLYTSDVFHTIHTLLDLHRFWQKIEHKDTHLGPAKQFPGNAANIVKVSLLQRIAAQLPGIGIDRSLTVAAHFGSIHRLLTADETEWLKVGHRIGPTTIKKILKEIREEECPAKDVQSNS